jgi:hypothetical protein
VKHRPCGACGELVPADTGCVHWKPGAVRKRAPRQPVSTRGRGTPPSVAEFQRMMGARP